MTTTNIRGDSIIILNGVERNLRPTFGALIKIEKATGRSLISTMKLIGSGEASISDVVAIVCGGLDGAGELNAITGRPFTADEAGELIVMSGFMPCFAAASGFLMSALTGGKPAASDEKKAVATA
jgi:hypothetical protein